VEQPVQWRTPITLTVLLLILLGAAYYGWQTVVSPATESGATPPTSPTKTKHTKQVCQQTKTYPKGTTVKATSFKVNVFNAGGISGEASNVLTTLHSKGFQEGVADNPPPRVTATNVSILTSARHSPIAELVKEQFKGRVRLMPGPNLAVGVDIVIGDKFIGVDPSAPTQLTVKRATRVCVKYKPS
jgi:LytR cell envelope-related transcriptional attenuator